MTEETKKFFTLKNNDDIITSRTDLDLINRPDQKVWVMNHIFINPDNHNEHEISILMEKVVKFVKESNKQVWPLDPIAIKYFKKHPELDDIWYHKPFMHYN